MSPTTEEVPVFPRLGPAGGRWPLWNPGSLVVTQVKAGALEELPPHPQYLSQDVDVHFAPLAALAEVHGRPHQQDVSHTVVIDVH